MPYNIWAIFTAAAHADAALPAVVRAAAACLILPNVLNGWWAYLMLKGFAKLLLLGGQKKGKKDATDDKVGGVLASLSLDSQPPPPPPPQQEQRHLKAA